MLLFLLSMLALSTTGQSFDDSYTIQELTTGANCDATAGCTSIYDSDRCRSAGSALGWTGSSLNTRTLDSAPAGCGKGGIYMYKNTNAASTYGCQSGVGTSSIACVCACAAASYQCPPVWDVANSAVSSVCPAGVFGDTCAISCENGYESLELTCQDVGGMPVWRDANGNPPTCSCTQFSCDTCPVQRFPCYSCVMQVMLVR